MFVIVKLSNLSLISLNLKTPNFIWVSHFISCFSHWFILFLQVFYYMVLIFHSFKGRSINHIFFSFGNFLLFKALTFWKLFLLFRTLTLFLKFFYVLKPFECFWICNFFQIWGRLGRLPGKSSRKSSNI